MRRSGAICCRRLMRRERVLSKLSQRIDLAGESGDAEERTDLKTMNS